MASGCRGVLIFIRAGKYPPGKRLFVMSAIQFSAQWAPLLREVNWVSILVRLCLAIFCGGVIGIERGRKGRTAGFRTHVLVCIGSALTVLTNQYMMQYFGSGDPARLGAQVINGIGFLGAGTIIVTGRHKVRGLTTAAGLWASACMGLAIGIGFYEAAVAACILILFVNSTLHRLDGYVISKSKVIELYVEFGVVDDISGFIAKMRQKDIRVSELEITKDANSSDAAVAATMLLRSTVRRDRAEILAIVSDVQGVKFVESI